MVILENTVVIKSIKELNAEMYKHNCKTKEELIDTFWFNYGTILIINA